MHPKHTALEALLLNAPPQIARRFWAKVQKTDTCWIWTGDRLASGYGRFNFRKTRLRAHRVAMLLAGIPLGDRRGCHTCDNPPCVRADIDPSISHLFPGTMSDNARDAKVKGRMRRPSWKFNAATAAAIRAEIAAGATIADLARLYAVHYTTIAKIADARTWPEQG